MKYLKLNFMGWRKKLILVQPNFNVTNINFENKWEYLLPTRL